MEIRKEPVAANRLLVLKAPDAKRLEFAWDTNTHPLPSLPFKPALAVVTQVY